MPSQAAFRSSVAKSHKNVQLLENVGYFFEQHGSGGSSFNDLSDLIKNLRNYDVS